MRIKKHLKTKSLCFYSVFHEEGLDAFLCWSFYDEFNFSKRRFRHDFCSCARLRIVWKFLLISIFIRQFSQGLCWNSAWYFAATFASALLSVLLSPVDSGCVLLLLFISSFLLSACVCLFFIVAAHKSYRVSVTVATVKRTNSVQEYLTTVFITIQFSRCLLLLAFGLRSLFDSIEFVCSSSFYPFIVGSLTFHHFERLQCKRLPLLFIMHFFHGIKLPFFIVLQSELASLNWHFVCCCEEKKGIMQRTFSLVPFLPFENRPFVLIHFHNETNMERNVFQWFQQTYHSWKSFLIYFPFWLLQWRIFGECVCFYCGHFFAIWCVFFLLCSVFHALQHICMLSLCLWMLLQVWKARCSFISLDNDG